MNKIQSKVLFVAALIIALMILFPPYIVNNFRGVSISAGYAFILNLPIYTTATGGHIQATVNLPTLTIQIFGALLVGCLVFFALSDKNN